MEGYNSNTLRALGFLNNHPISDAQFGITAVGGSGLGTDPPTSIEVRGNTFTNDHVGIFLPSNVFTTVTHIPLVDNTFNTASPLLPPCDAGLPNYSSNLGGYAGIVTLGTPLIVGTPGSSGYVNHFQLIRNGIISENGNLEVHRANFQDIRFAANVNTPPSFALSRNIGVLVNGGRGVVKNSNFNLVTRGVYGANNTLLDVTSNLMPSVWRGVETVSARSFNIRENDPIGFHNRGVYCREVIPTGFLNGHNISNNILSVVGFPGFPQVVGEVLVAIDIENAMNTTLPSAQLAQNNFTCGGFIFYDGIQVSGTGNWTINHNNMLYLDPVGFNASATAGIHLTNSANNYLYHNGVVDFNLTPQSIGFDIAGSTGNRFCCNMTYGDRIGTRFLGACGGTEWRHTKIRFHTYSLLCGAGTMISPQFDHANIFESSSGTAFHGGNNFEILLSQFRVLNTVQPHWPVVVDAPAAIQPWFVDQGSAPTCEEDGDDPGEPCEDPSTDMYAPDDDLDEVDRYAARNEINQGQYAPMVEWESKRGLYERMQKYPFLNGQDQDAQVLVDGLSAVNLLESNRKTVLGIYLQTLGSGVQSLTALQFSIVSPIAWQCPLEGGTAVYMARALYQLGEECTFDDDSLCTMAQERYSPKASVAFTGEEVRLAPNPTSQMVEVIGLQASEEQPVRIILTDVNGRHWFDREVSGLKAVISLHDMSAGGYICQVITKGRPPTALKLIVAR